MNALLLSFLAAVALAPLTASAYDPNKRLRTGDSVVFVKDVTFANELLYDERDVPVVGEIVEMKVNYRTHDIQCFLRLGVPANTKLIVRASRQYQIVDIATHLIQLDSGKTIGCRIRGGGSNQWSPYDLTYVEPELLERSLPMLKIQRVPPSPPTEREI